MFSQVSVCPQEEVGLPSLLVQVLSQPLVLGSFRGIVGGTPVLLLVLFEGVGEVLQSCH